MATLSPIPQPPTIPFLGNVTLIDLDVPIRTFMNLAKQYGEIYQMSFPGGIVLVHVNSVALVRQLSDDSRFKKSVSRGLREVRNLAGDGLFTADIEEPNWGIARECPITSLPPFPDNTPVAQIGFSHQPLVPQTSGRCFQTCKIFALKCFSSGSVLAHHMLLIRRRISPV